MLHFGTQSANNLVWGQKTPGAVAADGSGIQQERAVRSWLSMSGQTLGGIGFYRSVSGQPLALALSGAYKFDTYVTAYAYVSGQYSFALLTMLSVYDSLGLSDAPLNNTSMRLLVADSIALSEVAAANKIAFVALTDSLTLQEVLANNVSIGIALSDALFLADSILSNTPLLSYVVNANTFALTKYSNFNFNSFARLGSKHYGVQDDGVYELGGETDNGANIDASITLGKNDYGSEHLKKVPAIYIGTHANGDMVLKVSTDSGAINYYSLTALATGDLQSNRITPGKGLQSRYWQYELSNVNGGDIDIESIVFSVVQLSRRIGGV